MTSLLAVERISEPIDSYLASAVRVLRTFGERRDSKTSIVGVEQGGHRYVIKASRGERSTEWLRSAVRFHGAVSHPTIVPLLHWFETPAGIALVYPWAAGDVLIDGYDDAVRDRDDPRSTYQRFLALPAAEIVGALAQIVDAHVAVVEAGFVAVDLFDGCVIYDFDQKRMQLIDLDHYEPGPYVLAHDRQLGSTSLMAPEELQRGATIDERTTVYTLARMALVYLGCGRSQDEPPDRAAFRGDARFWELLRAATARDPADRVQTVAELRARWAT